MSDNRRYRTSWSFNTIKVRRPDRHIPQYFAGLFVAAGVPGETERLGNFATTASPRRSLPSAKLRYSTTQRRKPGCQRKPAPQTTGATTTGAAGATTAGATITAGATGATTTGRPGG